MKLKICKSVNVNPVCKPVQTVQTGVGLLDSTGLYTPRSRSAGRCSPLSLAETAVLAPHWLPLFTSASVPLVAYYPELFSLSDRHKGLTSTFNR